MTASHRPQPKSHFDITRSTVRSAPLARTEPPYSGEHHALRDAVEMRRLEVTALLPDFSLHQAAHMVPQTELFDRAVSGFARGTVLATPNGPCAIEDLMPGDPVQSSAGPQQVLWIGSTTLLSGQAGAASLLNGLIRVTGDALGRGRPSHDMMFGPAAAVLHNPPQMRVGTGEGRVLTPLADFIDGVSVFRVTPPSAVRVYHLMLRKHAVVTAGGLEVESYHPGSGGRIAQMGSQTQSLFMSLFPGIAGPRDFGPLGFPRVEREMLEGLG
ncbi:Hint domain-containing protein [Marinovum sp. 2_MG-2023]|uniref:Hint domain-containing protein n=1 Tax=unclassified Marinovum TaxID=2647166 RepID=UPI0026E1CC69|nr:MULTISPECIES: Hint domain-containing protein [unclassified Marinovum]MDO6731737.1 Hint domain-containing protein [Marinovum sp. 2_MG-2023]MDO6780989.1 Hint domain-containing protein [Marinovum sp. 1_MG-2023]